MPANTKGVTYMDQIFWLILGKGSLAYPSTKNTCQTLLRTVLTPTEGTNLRTIKLQAHPSDWSWATQVGILLFWQVSRRLKISWSDAISTQNISVVTDGVRTYTLLWVRYEYKYLSSVLWGMWSSQKGWPRKLSPWMALDSKYSPSKVALGTIPVKKNGKELQRRNNTYRI